MNEAALKKLPLALVYNNLYPWSSLNQFVDQLVNTIAYKSDDGSLLAINKPFGVGTYTTHDLNSQKTNQDRVLSNIGGKPRYCISDALLPLTDHLNSPKPYKVLKGIDRYASGLVLLTNDLNKHKVNLARSQQFTKINSLPPYGFRVITCGYPLTKSTSLFERVGCELVEVDELGDHKEPVLSQNPGWSFKGKHKHKSLFQVQLNVKKIERELATALIEVHVSKMKWDFVRCYISSKTSFILGDVRFSKRIREILGKRIQVSAFRSNHKFDDPYEPLSAELQKILGVKRNSSIPLMLDHHELCLRNFWGSKSQEKDLIIKSSYVPLHFAATACRLNLLDALDSMSNTILDNHVEHNRSDAVA
uniref:RNA pseudouridylate synthase domain-containing protein 4 n=1 Tax=Aceria tosichella TaxID=561515 RepID=A0A6G1SHI8_9ACAR